MIDMSTLQPDETGNIPSPFPYLNSDSDEWKGDDEFGGFDNGGGGVMARRQPVEPRGGGGMCAEIEPEGFMLSPLSSEFQLLPAF